MNGVPPSAVIFDVDGVLLELTPAEEDAFFAPFETLYGLTGLSRDWDSYRIRNDEEIIKEVFERRLGRPPAAEELARHVEEYCSVLEHGYSRGRLAVRPIPGAPELLEALRGVPGLTTGAATANLHRAAAMRLRQAGLWGHVGQHCRGADGGGHKSEVLARLISRLAVPPERTIYVGDNLNDLEAGRASGVHFIGFATEEHRRHRLAAAGAKTVSGDHRTTLGLIDAALRVF
jgi:phosphoglycolate phosphatase-like HAD superfamily hydrolase